MLDNFEKYDCLPQPIYSNRHKKRINRIFREIVKSPKTPYPEVDNSYERIRSKIKLFIKKEKRQ